AHVAVCFDTVHSQAYLDFLKLMLGFDAMRNDISLDVGDIRFNPVKAWVDIGSTASTTTVTIAYFTKLDAKLASVSSTRLLILMAA
ncbi:MAG: hypothetical protein H7X92_10940, partial [Chitinophagales bacterium]|nr:hypothetical protein [Hyphomicrobiales bacterium]